MSQLALNLPVAGLPNTTEDAKVIADFTLIQNVINGNLDSGNIANSLAQSAAVNTASQTVKGAVNIATTESRASTTYGTLTTPDQVTGIVLPTNGLIAVWYQATWQESGAGFGRAAIFIGANQMVVASTPAGGGPVTVAAATGSGATASDIPLFSTSIGLASLPATGYTGDLTTGQAVGWGAAGATQSRQEVNGVVQTIPANVSGGGPCYIFAAAGTYSVSVQFKALGGSVTAKNRKLWVQAISFA